MQSRRALLVNAEPIRELAQALCEQSEPKTLAPDAWSKVLLSEVETLFSIIGTYHVQIVAHPVIRSRIEYLLCSIQHLLPWFHKCADHIPLLLTNLFRLFKTILSLGRDEATSSGWREEDDILSITNTVRSWDGCIDRPLFGNLFPQPNPNQSSWDYIALTTLSVILAEMLRQFPAYRSSLPVSSLEAIALLNSNQWQVQHVGLSLCLVSLRLECQAAVHRRGSFNGQKAVRQSSSSSTSFSSPSLSSGKLGPSSATLRSATTKPPKKASEHHRAKSTTSIPIDRGSASEIVQLCRSGGIRQLLWCAFHRHWRVRSLCAEVMCAIRLITREGSAAKEFAIACVEQGLVVVLEIVARGLPIFDGTGDRSTRFPEEAVRQAAESLLMLLVDELSQADNVEHRQRLVSALTYSTDALRKNTFLSVMHLVGRSGRLAQLLFAQPHLEGKERTISVRTTFEYDAGAVVSLLEMLGHFLSAANGTYSSPASGQRTTRAKEIATQTQDATHEKRESFSPMVLVLQGAKLVRMACPPLQAIHAHSPQLAERISLSQQKQLKMLGVVGEVGPTEWQRVMHELPEQAFERLNGAYEVWQELFSHMTDDFVRQASLASLSEDRILQCLELAEYHQISPLFSSYCHILQCRLREENLLKILNAASRGPHLHLSLCIACLRFLRQNPHLLTAVQKRPARLRESAELWQQLQLLCASFGNSSS